LAVIAFGVTGAVLGDYIWAVLLQQQPAALWKSLEHRGHRRRGYDAGRLVPDRPAGEPAAGQG